MVDAVEAPVTEAKPNISAGMNLGGEEKDNPNAIIPSLQFVFAPGRDNVPNKPYHEDGNIQFYTKEARKARRHMKKDPLVKESINNFIKDNFTATGPSNNRVVQKEEYISKFTRIAESLYNGSGRDPEEIAKWVKDDFEADSQDKPEEEESDDDPAGSDGEANAPTKKEKAK